MKVYVVTYKSEGFDEDSSEVLAAGMHEPCLKVYLKTFRDIANTYEDVQYVEEVEGNTKKVTFHIGDKTETLKLLEFGNE